MLLERLRNETQPHHQLLEADLDLLNPRFTLADYQTLLLRFFGYYAPWEDRVCAFDPCLLLGRSKSALLIADLQYLGTVPPGSGNATLCDALPALDTRARILGSMYVIEGATLGGQILRREFVPKFGFNGDGCAFFTGYGNRTGQMWKQFGEVVNALPAKETNAAVASAVATFESMHAWLCVSRIGRE